MRAIALLEFRELRGLIGALMVPVFVFSAFAAYFAHVLPAYLVLAATVGALWGMGQGYQDRRQRKNGFLLHRPLSATRVHVARTAVGVLACGLLMGLVPVFMGFFTPDEKISIGRATSDVLADRAAQDWGVGSEHTERWFVWPREFRSWNLQTLGWPLLTCLLFWAVTRLVFSVRRRSAVFLAAPAVLILTLLAFLRVESYVFPTLAMIVLGAVSATLTLLNLTAREI